MMCSQTQQRLAFLVSLVRHAVIIADVIRCRGIIFLCPPTVTSAEYSTTPEVDHDSQCSTLRCRHSSACVCVLFFFTTQPLTSIAKMDLLYCCATLKTYVACLAFAHLHAHLLSNSYARLSQRVNPAPLFWDCTKCLDSYHTKGKTIYVKRHTTYIIVLNQPCDIV